MIKAKIKLPEIKSKKVWGGLYNGHYDVIVFFDKKPVISKEPYHLPNIIDSKYYDLLDNKDCILGALYLVAFYKMYPGTDLSKYLSADNNRPKAIEVIEVFEMELEGCWDEFGRLNNIEYNADGWGK